MPVVSLVCIHLLHTGVSRGSPREAAAALPIPRSGRHGEVQHVHPCWRLCRDRRDRLPGDDGRRLTTAYRSPSRGNRNRTGALPVSHPDASSERDRITGGRRREDPGPQTHPGPGAAAPAPCTHRGRIQPTAVPAAGRLSSRRANAGTAFRGPGLRHPAAAGSHASPGEPHTHSHPGRLGHPGAPTVPPSARQLGPASSAYRGVAGVTLIAACAPGRVPLPSGLAGSRSRGPRTTAGFAQSARE